MITKGRRLFISLFSYHVLSRTDECASKTQLSFVGNEGKRASWMPKIGRASWRRVISKDIKDQRGKWAPVALSDIQYHSYLYHTKTLFVLPHVAA